MVSCGGPPCRLPLAAPPGADVGFGFPWWVWLVTGLFAVLALYAAWDTRRQRTKVPRAEQVAELKKELRTGAPNARGHVRVTPGRFPALTTAEAERVANEAGFARQTHGTKGLWLFYREGTRPGSAESADVRGGPRLDELRQSTAARRMAEWSRERDGFDPLDETTLKAAEDGVHKLRAKRDRLVMGAAFALMAGAFTTVAVGAAWLNGTLPHGFTTGSDWSAYVLGHVVAAGGLLLGGHWIRRGKQAMRESRTRHQPVIAAYRDAVLAREAESDHRPGTGQE
ncbi:hypothetical protein ADK76_24065 [Streptomyces griseoflavus]|uniref:hypothetical protein n=1 Tax=Streptomyces rimosus TaxID=1927 RepID=UPI0004C98EE2|nr:hypothetical protein [Streptomyces rimosus]KOG54366.1 hypothetical protein ADK76_24065 [Streptomyces griseoflavus]